MNSPPCSALGTLLKTIENNEIPKALSFHQKSPKPQNLCSHNPYLPPKSSGLAFSPKQPQDLLEPPGAPKQWSSFQLASTETVLNKTPFGSRDCVTLALLSQLSQTPNATKKKGGRGEVRGGSGTRHAMPRRSDSNGTPRQWSSNPPQYRLRRGRKV